MNQLPFFFWGCLPLVLCNQQQCYYFPSCPHQALMIQPPYFVSLRYCQEGRYDQLPHYHFLWYLLQAHSRPLPYFVCQPYLLQVIGSLPPCCCWWCLHPVH